MSTDTSFHLYPGGPREKLWRCGAAALREEELWMCVLGWGRRGHSVRSLAGWLSRPGVLEGAGGGIKGEELRARLGSAQAARVLAVREIWRRYDDKNQSIITSPQDVLLACQPLRTARQELLYVLYCAAGGQLLRTLPVAMGSINMVAIEPRDIFAQAMDIPVDSLVLCHNHPSGEATPSSADIVFTHRIMAACSLMGFWLRDHLIITKNNYYSLRAAGQLEVELEAKMAPG